MRDIYQEVTVNGRPIAYDTCPVAYMADGLKLYFEHGVPPGSFMLSVLSNDLREACGRADEANSASLVAWVRWLYNNAPMGSWGSPDAVREWQKARRTP